MITSRSAAARRGRAVGLGRQGAQAALLDLTPERFERLRQVAETLRAPAGPAGG